MLRWASVVGTDQLLEVETLAGYESVDIKLHHNRDHACAQEQYLVMHPQRRGKVTHSLPKHHT